LNLIFFLIYKNIFVLLKKFSVIFFYFGFWGALTFFFLVV
jgi:hypothetical protein